MRGRPPPPTFRKRMTGKRTAIRGLLTACASIAGGRCFRWAARGAGHAAHDQELSALPTLGFSARAVVRRTTNHGSYWRSSEALMAYARAAPRDAAWRDFKQAGRHNGDVGIWHETYSVQPRANTRTSTSTCRVRRRQGGELVEASGRREHARGGCSEATATGRSGGGLGGSRGGARPAGSAVARR